MLLLSLSSIDVARFRIRAYLHIANQVKHTELLYFCVYQRFDIIASCLIVLGMIEVYVLPVFKVLLS